MPGKSSAPSECSRAGVPVDDNMSNLEAACDHSSKAASACPFTCSREFSAASISSNRQRGATISGDSRPIGEPRAALAVGSRSGHAIVGRTHPPRKLPSTPCPRVDSSALRRGRDRVRPCSRNWILRNDVRRMNGKAVRGLPAFRPRTPIAQGPTSRCFPRHGSFQSPAAREAQHSRKIPASELFLSLDLRVSLRRTSRRRGSQTASRREVLSAIDAMPYTLKRKGAGRHEEPAGTMTFIAARRNQARE